MKISTKYFDEKSINELYVGYLSGPRKDKYKNKKFDFLQSAKTIDVSLEVVKGFSKIKGSSFNTDAKNAIKLYSGIGHLPIDIALDARLWIYLTHVTYRPYMFERWHKKDKSITIHDRYFGLIHYKNDRGLVRNGISRLYWGARLTVKDDKPEFDYYFKNTSSPYAYTKILFSDSNLFEQITGHKLGRNKKIVLSILHYIKQKKIKISKDISLSIIKTLCLQTYTNNLSTLSPKEIFEVYESIIEID